MGGGALGPKSDFGSSSSTWMSAGLSLLSSVPFLRVRFGVAVEWALEVLRRFLAIETASGAALLSHSFRVSSGASRTLRS